MKKTLIALTLFLVLFTAACVPEYQYDGYRKAVDDAGNIAEDFNRKIEEADDIEEESPVGQLPFQDDWGSGGGEV